MLTGLPVFVGSDGADKTYATICPTANEYNDWVDSGPGTHCWHSPSGTPAHVLSISIDQRGTQETGLTQRDVLLHADDGKWKGYTGADVSIYPRIPIGAHLTLDTKSNAQEKLNSSQTADDGPTLDLGATVKVLKYEPTTRDDNIYVQVTSGSHAGSKGWLVYLTTFAVDQP